MEDGLNKIKIEPIIWWGIDAKNEVKKFDSPQNKKISYWIKQTDVGERNTTSFGNTYNIYQFEIFDMRKKNAEILFNNWKIRRIYDPLGRNAFNGTKAEYVDPRGEIKTIEVYNIENALKKLNEISDFENWQNYDLKVLNAKITDENDQLKKENEELRSKIDAFMSTRLYKVMSRKVEKIKTAEGRPKEMLKSFIKEYSVNSNFFNEWFIR